MFDDVIQLYSDPKSAALVALIMAAPIADEEKQSWLEILPFMKDDEKNNLAKNLQEEIADFEQEKDRIIAQFQSGQ